MGLVGGGRQSSGFSGGLSGDLGRSAIDDIPVGILLSQNISTGRGNDQRGPTHASATPGTTATSTATSATATGRETTTLSLPTFSFSGRLRRAGDLHRDLALQNGLPIKVVDGTVSLTRDGDIDKRVTDWAGGTRIGGDRNGLARSRQLCVTQQTNFYLHLVVLEEFFQLSLGGRISEVSDVQSPPFGSAGENSLILRRINGLISTSTDGGALGSAGGFGKGSGGHLGSNTFDGHVDCSLLLNGTKCLISRFGEAL